MGQELSWSYPKDIFLKKDYFLIRLTILSHDLESNEVNKKPAVVANADRQEIGKGWPSLGRPWSEGRGMLWRSSLSKKKHIQTFFLESKLIWIAPFIILRFLFLGPQWASFCVALVKWVKSVTFENQTPF